MRITWCKTYKGGMAQREINNKTIRHYCQPGKLIYYIFNFQRGSSEGYSQTFPVPRLVVFFWVQIFGFTVSWVYKFFFFLGYSKYWYFYGVTLIKMHILTYFLLICVNFMFFCVCLFFFVSFSKQIV